jgi:hypothetical protein
MSSDMREDFNAKTRRRKDAKVGPASKPAVSADFQIGGANEVAASADFEIRDTAQRGIAATEGARTRLSALRESSRLEVLENRVATKLRFLTELREALATARQRRRRIRRGQAEFGIAGGFPRQHFLQ